jgi:hypothetical protein
MNPRRVSMPAGVFVYMRPVIDANACVRKKAMPVFTETALAMREPPTRGFHRVIDSHFAADGGRSTAGAQRP